MESPRPELLEPSVTSEMTELSPAPTWIMCTWPSGSGLTSPVWFIEIARTDPPFTWIPYQVPA